MEPWQHRYFPSAKASFVFKWGESMIFGWGLAVAIKCHHILNRAFSSGELGQAFVDLRHAWAPLHDEAAASCCADTGILGSRKNDESACCI